METNTELEEAYFVSRRLHGIAEIGSRLKDEFVREGNEHIRRLLKEGNTGEGPDSAYDVLGCVGLFMAACRRHGITDPSRERTSPLVDASSLALHIATTLGVAPRFATSHLTTHNPACDGVYRSFTSLEDERIFLDYNTLGVFGYMKAAEALRRILPMGVSHPLTHHLLEDATSALAEVAAFNDKLFAELDVERFFYCVRPYYKSYRVGPTVYRGANAGDFSGINVIDLLLGLCSADNPKYSQILIDKFLYMIPAEQAMLKDAMSRRSLLSEFLAASRTSRTAPWFRRNLSAFLEVLAAHGHTAHQHHDYLVRRFIEEPADRLPPEALEDLTASGPPLPVLLQALEDLRDMRTAAKRDDLETRHADVERLKKMLA